MKTIRRRRKEAKTDYKSRFALIKSGKPRLIIRKTNKNIILQIAETDLAKDKILVTAESKELLESGWPKKSQGSLKSLAAAYLTGFLLVKKLNGKTNEAILDLGLNRNVHGSRLYAALKGALEAGLEVSHNPKSLPTEERIKSSLKAEIDIDKMIKEIKK
jgi:large subunit ribosomal protein L18